MHNLRNEHGKMVGKTQRDRFTKSCRVQGIVVSNDRPRPEGARRIKDRLSYMTVKTRQLSHVTDKTANKFEGK